MVHSCTLAYLRTRSLPELFVLHTKLQQQLATLREDSAEHSEVTLALQHIRYLLASRAPGFGPR
ncbi:hypothetical protein WGT02_03700 [Rhizobium sp. T1470]|uniref:hypothetical protein n=1 Tax=unclassified Rhizobium TaxID=2613769 RepID=UPI001AAE3BAE|nr:hypothetical protein [Rhizobium sp. T1473]